MNEIEISKVRISIIQKMYQSKFNMTDIAKVMKLAIPTVQRYVRQIPNEVKQE